MESMRYMDNNKDNVSCYHLEKLVFDSNSALLNIDATYVIHLVNNGRLDSVRAQLNEFKPTKEVFILHNKGYKKCDKDAIINKPTLDLVDAFLYIFKDAQKKDYKHILILEDDFIFNKKIKDKKVRQNIMNFIKNKNYDIYGLGILPFLQKAYDNNTSICFIGIGTHALIYSRNCINKTLELRKSKLTINKHKFHDWDYFTGWTFRKYIYNEPLCYQLFPKTENQDSWVNMERVISLLKMLKLDTQVEPGFSILYIASRAVFGLCIFIVVLLFIIIFKL
jgi:hypothetical protein